VHIVDRHLNLISYNTQTSTMILKSMLIVLLLALVGCGSVSKKPAQPEKQPNDHEDAFITPENERYCAGGSGTRSIKFLEI
jgi:uncharacterized protein YceK